MNVLIIGSGGREHAIGWRLKANLFFAPGNGGTAELGTNVDIPVDQIDRLAEFAAVNAIDLTIVGPEQPLQLGIADVFRKKGLAVFGPNKSAARLETSKAYAKAFMDKYGIPTARYEVYEEAGQCLEALDSWRYPLVVKADGLAAGKGVIICGDKAEAVGAVNGMMTGRVFGTAGERVVIEEYLEGREASLLCFTDGKTIVPMESAGDYKRAKDGGGGLNTGGMGSISPAPWYKPGIGDEIAEKTLAGIQKEGFDYRGVIYIGLMLTKEGPKVLEYNVRFGDPETEALMLRLDTDLLEIVRGVIEGRLSDVRIRWKKEPAVCVVMVSGGYPEGYETGFDIELPQPRDAVFFHGGTVLSGDGLKTSGGRVLMASALGEDLEAARKRAYENAGKVRFRNMYYRKDIGRLEDFEETL